ncbi:MAG: ABC transporter permease [Eubacterium sp.]|nr:ABC transporter permease [Eubacterium sp.]
MFLHNLKYEILDSLRAKALVIWLILFPIVLGVFFKVAMGNVYENDVLFSKIKTAVVIEEKNEAFDEVMKSVTEGDDPLLEVTYADKDKAMKLLEDGKVEGIIFANDELRLSITGKGYTQSVLKSFCDQYNSQARILKSAFEENPLKLMMIADDLKKEVKSINNIPLSNGNTDIYLQYFFNLIAMVGLFGSITGLHISITNQANESKLGARKNCSPTPKSLSIAASLIGSFLVQSICMICCVTFDRFVLGVDFGPKLPLVYVGAILSGITGVTFGFFIGSIGSLSEGVKTGLLSGFSMLCCFASGLMVGDIKGTIEANVPIINHINPAAVMSDIFYSLNMYDDYSRFFRCIITLIIMSAVFTILGFISTRRKKYASI